ncbi:MAG: hypothetical protein FJY85_06675 [Deltaproteobacteria bacterium]|nr:hypothetical protein [Deltaproteobacteria bacterium]
MTGFRFPNFIRVTVSGLEPLGAFVEALERILVERSKSSPDELRLHA